MGIVAYAIYLYVFHLPSLPRVIVYTTIPRTPSPEDKQGRGGGGGEAYR
jgi:hypothetical protein